MAASLREYLRQLCEEAESIDKQHKKIPARSGNSQRRSAKNRANTTINSIQQVME